jgi:UDP-2-acetamido-3-amino-2,3-dideoxy-glucuronate N-acetyltransferase
MEKSVRIHPTAIVEDGVSIGSGSRVWDNVHIRGPETVIGSDCIVGEKSYIAYGVTIGDRVKINAFVYVCTAVTIETGVMLAAGTTFTNDVFPRACTDDLSALRPSDPDEETLPTLVREGATIGARTVIGCDLTIGRFAMTGMGSVVTRSIPDFHLVVGSPARTIGCVCRCGHPFLRVASRDGVPDAVPDGTWTCNHCSRVYRTNGGVVTESP